MNLNEYAAFDGLGLAGLVSTGEVMPAELCAIARQAMEETNPALNFLVGATPQEEQKCLNGLPERSTFGGIPTLLKDIGPKAAGVPQGAGSLLAQGLVAESDSEIVRRWRKAGFIFLGRSTTPEMGSSFTTESRATGDTLNPWDTTRSTGGSSGGAAAAIASGVVPIAMGGDSGGSIRVPAHCCGLFGFKPSRGRNPVGPEAAENNSGFTQAHVLTRSVRDSAAVLDATHGPDPGCKYSCPPPQSSFLDAVNKPISALRVAWSNHNCFGGEVHPEIRIATERAAGLMADLGHQVEEATPPVDGEEMIDIFDIVWTANMHYGIQAIAGKTGRTPGPENLEGSTQGFCRRGAEVSSAELLWGLDIVNRVSRKLGRFFEDYDILISPVFSLPAPPIGDLNTDVEVADVKQLCWDVFRVGAFTSQFNISGQPAMSVPLYRSSEGLPIGVQFAAGYCAEETLFALAGQLEQAAPWSGRRAPIHLSNATT